MTKQNSFDIAELQQKANDGDAQAQFDLALCYENGTNIERNNESALMWLAKSAEQDFADAQHRLAICYLVGKCVEKSNEHGVKWMIYAAGQGHPEANNWLTNAYLSLAIPSCLSDKKDAEQYYKFAIEWCLTEVDGHNAIEAYLLLGILHYSGKGVEKNDVLAIGFFEKAEYMACNGYDQDDDPDNNESISAFASLYVGICYAQGKSISTYYSPEKNGFEYYKGHFDSSRLRLFGEVFVEGIIAMPFHGLHHNKIFLTLLRLSIYKKAGEYALAKEFIKEVFDKTAGMDKNFKEICLTGIQQEQEIAEKNKTLEAEIKQKELLQIKMQKLVEQFTHTLGNVIFPDTIYQVAERLKTNPDCRKDVLLLNEAYHSEIIIKLQGELLRQRHTSTNPEKFRQLIRACRQTANVGNKTKSIADVLDYAASRVTARFLNQHNASLGSIRDSILSRKNVSLEALKQKFEDDILLNRSLGSVEWINQNLRPFKVVNASPLWQKVFILAESHAEALLFGHFSEVLFNAFKYADHTADEFLTVAFDESAIDGKIYLTCSWQNPLGDKAINSLGTGKGLDAIQEDLMQLNDAQSQTNSLLVVQENQQFQVTIFFKKDLLINNAPTLKIPR